MAKKSPSLLVNLVNKSGLWFSFRGPEIPFFVPSKSQKQQTFGLPYMSSIYLVCGNNSNQNPIYHWDTYCTFSRWIHCNADSKYLWYRCQRGITICLNPPPHHHQQHLSLSSPSSAASSNEIKLTFESTFSQMSHSDHVPWSMTDTQMQWKSESVTDQQNGQGRFLRC